MISELTTTTLVEWSRWQFAMTAIYHYMFVPLTLGLSFLLAIMETMWDNGIYRRNTGSKTILL